MLTIEYIREVVCGHFGIHQKALDMKTRRREIVLPRQVAHYFARKYTNPFLHRWANGYKEINVHGVSLQDIGRKIGNKDHATVLHSIKTVNNLKDSDKEFRYQMDLLELNFGTWYSNCIQL